VIALTHEARFTGAANAGLRARIRTIVATYDRSTGTSRPDAIRRLAAEAGQAGDFRMVLMCELAMGHAVDRADWTDVSRADWSWLAGYDRASALAACVDVIAMVGHVSQTIDMLATETA